jgi:hypothetical protein
LRQNSIHARSETVRRTILNGQTTDAN